jgi:hypothetical protein
MIYIFGDLRQLRKFELHRPPISRPRPIPTVPTSLSITVPVPAAITRQPRLPPNLPPRRMSMIPQIPQPTNREYNPRPPSPSLSTLSTGSASDESYTSCDASTSAYSHSRHEPEIHISPAYFDHVPIDIASMVNSAAPSIIPPISPVGLDDSFPLTPLSPPLSPATVLAHELPEKSYTFSPTAPFIHPYTPHARTPCRTDECCQNASLPEHNQPLSPFDFDALPTHPRRRNLNCADNTNNNDNHERSQTVIIQPDESDPGNRQSLRSWFTPKVLLARAQYRCNLNIWKLDVPRDLLPGPHGSCRPPLRSHQYQSQNQSDTIRTQYKLVQSVPAFTSPITRVLNPVVVRAQWEIVVRSAAYAFKAACVILGCLLIIPPRKQ